MSKKLFRLIELTAAALAGGMTALYRVSLARKGTELIFGGVSYPAGGLYLWTGVCVLAMAGAALLLRDKQILRKGGGGRLHTGLLALSALTLFGAFALLLAEGAATLFQIIQLIFLALCGVAMILKIVLGERHKLTGLLSLFPVYYLCLFLLLFYRENAKNPSVQSFALDILAVMAMVVAVYIVSAAKFEKPKHRQQIFFTLCGVYLFAVQLASALLYPALVLTVPGMSRGVLCMLGGFALYLAASFFWGPLPVAEEGGEAPLTAGQAVELPPDGSGEDSGEALAEADRDALLRTILRDAAEYPPEDGITEA